MSMEKIISPFIEAQFPQFYREEGPNFIAFVKAYYEWLEQKGNVIQHARSIPQYLDIDQTEEEFIKYFKANYFDSLPSNIAADKRLLVKHILELYRSKGTKRAYELLFRLMFNEDIEIYLPNEHLMKTSDATWYIPQYIEVSDSEFLFDLIGKKITSPAATAIVESYSTKLVHGKVVNVLHISDLNGRFKFSEKIYCDDLYVKKIYQNDSGEQINQTQYDALYDFQELVDLDSNVYISPAQIAEQERYRLLYVSKINSHEYSLLSDQEQANYQLALNFDNAPVIFGSLSSISIINGGFGFEVGDLLNVSGSGVDGVARVVSTRADSGRVAFKLLDGGYGFTMDALVAVTGGYGTGAHFEIGALTDIQRFRVNLDPISGVYSEDTDVEIDSASSGFSIYYKPIAGNPDISTYTNISSSSNTLTLDVIGLVGNVAFGETLSNTALGINGLYVYNSDVALNSVNQTTINAGIIQVTNSVSTLTNVNLQPGVTLTNGKTGDNLALVTIQNIAPIEGSAVVNVTPGAGTVANNDTLCNPSLGIFNLRIFAKNGNDLTIVGPRENLAKLASTQVLSNQKQPTWIVVGSVATVSGSKRLTLSKYSKYSVDKIDDRSITVGDVFKNNDLGISVGVTVTGIHYVAGTTTIDIDSVIDYITVTGDISSIKAGTILFNQITPSTVTVNTISAITGVPAIADIDYNDSEQITTNNYAYGYFVPSAPLTISKTGSTSYTTTIGGRFDEFSVELKPTVRLTDWRGSFIKEQSIEVLTNLDIPTLGDILTFEDKDIGKIAYITNINPGSGYSFDPTVTIVEPSIYNYRVPDGNGGFWGHNAVVSAKASTRGGVVTGIDVFNSGFGYNPDETVYMNSKTNTAAVTGAAIVDVNGIGAGYWKDFKSFTSDGNYIQDSYYYQTYSYEIIANRMLSTYEKVVKDLVHPSGMALFGKYRIYDNPVNDDTYPAEFSLTTTDYFTVDTIKVTVDSSMTVDKTYFSYAS